MGISFHSPITLLRRVFRAVVLAVGMLALLGVVLAFTPAPWRVYHWLGTDQQELAGPPDYIIVLGGGGIPSKSGLMRTYHAADLARTYPKAKVIVALPAEKDLKVTSTDKMKEELALRGVSRTRLWVEDKGRNTREQALNMRKLFPAPNEPTLLIVTCPEHMKRAILAFRHVGFNDVTGSAAFEESVDMPLSYEKGSLGGRDIPGSAVGRSERVRYRLWNNLAYMGRSLRESVALAYYEARGWI